MDSVLLTRIYSRLTGELRPRRFLHVMGVMHRAVELAGVTGADPERVLLAAALHDIGKELKPAVMRERLKAWGADIPPEDEGYVALWHAWYGREAARREFGIEDDLVLDAIACHPTGRPGMTAEDAALFLADFIEPLRDFEPLHPIETIARESVDRALLTVLEEKIAHVENVGKAVHGRAIAAREYYRKKMNDE